MAYREIEYGVSGAVATVRLNRPDKLNAWTAVMEDEFTEAILAAGADSAIRVIVVTGAGRGFCAGADMSLLDQASRAAGPVAGHDRIAAGGLDGLPEESRKRYAWMLTVPKPIVAAINGPAVGLGMVIALYCDLRVAAASARMATVFARRGLIAEYGMAWILPRLIGVGQAMDLLMTGRMVDAGEAHRMGLVQRVFEDDAFAAGAEAFAGELASTVSPRSLAVMKRQIWEGLSERLGESIDRAFLEMRASLGSADFREGVAHFLEKRAPRFPDA
ncbi:MAG: enoyl-CoA hydratase-related protein [Bryobacteraceae bacterium]